MPKCQLLLTAARQGDGVVLSSDSQWLYIWWVLFLWVWTNSQFCSEIVNQNQIRLVGFSYIYLFASFIRLYLVCIFCSGAFRHRRIRPGLGSGGARGARAPGLPVKGPPKTLHFFKVGLIIILFKVDVIIDYC